MKLHSNKKGASLDNIFVAVSFFSFAIVCFVALFFWNTVSTDTGLDEDLWTASSVGANIKQDAQDFYDDIDFWMILIYFGLHIGIIVTAFLLRSHPIIYIAGLFLIIILMLIANPLQSAWEEVYNEGDFTSIRSQIPITAKVLSNFVMFEMVFGFITLIILAGLARHNLV